MNDQRIIVLAVPLFFALIGIEIAVGIARGRNTYRLNDALNSLGLGIVSQLVGVFVKLFAIGLYTIAWTHVAIFRLSPGSLWVWLAGLVLYDLCYYAYHRAEHRVGVLWAAHAVHHHSEDYNLSTALRQSSTGWIAGWLFYLPMAVIGIPPVVFATVALIDLLYQFWVHTQQVGRLGWFDRWFCAPSNHRVHHAVNERYLDRNYGGIFIVWDRMFGSYAAEDDTDPCVYGTRKPLRNWNPLWSNLQVYADLALDAWRARRWSDKLRVWLMPPGWRPADVQARWPRPAFALSAFERYDPPIGRGAAGLAIALFVGLLAATLTFLWFAQDMTLAQQVVAASLIVVGTWLVGALCTPRGERGAASNPAKADPSVA